MIKRILDLFRDREHDYRDVVIDYYPSNFSPSELVQVVCKKCGHKNGQKIRSTTEEECLK